MRRIKNLGREIYESIDMEPLGSASIAQVHFAQLKNGQSVVLKIQRPYIYERMERDVSLLLKSCQGIESF